MHFLEVQFGTMQLLLEVVQLQGQEGYWVLLGNPELMFVLVFPIGSYAVSYEPVKTFCLVTDCWNWRVAALLKMERVEEGGDALKRAL